MITKLSAVFAAFGLALTMASGPAAAQGAAETPSLARPDELFLATPRILPPTPSGTPSTPIITCQPGEVLDVLGNNCLPEVSLPATPRSLLNAYPDDILVAPLTPPPLFLNGTDCPSGLVLKSNGEPCQ